MPAGDRQDFAAFITHFRVCEKLQQEALLRLGVGLVGTLLAVGYNLIRASGAPPEVRPFGWEAVAVFVLACAIALWWFGRRWRRALRRPVSSLREAVLQIGDHHRNRANLLLILAAAGHVLLLAGTVFRFSLVGPDGAVLWLTLLPSLMLIMHTAIEWPNLDRLCDAYARIGSPGTGEFEKV